MALLISGELRQFWYCADSILNNLVIPNDLDVFVMTGNNKSWAPFDMKEDENNPSVMSMSACRECPEQKIELNEYEMIRNKMGRFLKGINKSNYIPNYLRELEEIRAAASEKYFALQPHGKYPPYLFNILQYLLVSKGIELIEDYEVSQGIKYDYIFKIRPDMLIKEGAVDIMSFIKNPTVPAHLEGDGTDTRYNASIYLPNPFQRANPRALKYSCTPNECVVDGPRSVECVHDYIFLFKREVGDLVKNFVHQYGSLRAKSPLPADPEAMRIVERQWAIHIENNKEFKPSNLHTWCVLEEMKKNKYNVKGSAYSLYFY